MPLPRTPSVGLVTPSTTIRYRPDIQGLRAVAVAAVVLSHANVPGFAGGFIGVDVFFVLSGFLITGLLVKERLSTGRVVYWRFLVRRVRRLLPAMLVMLVTVLIIGSVVLTGYEMRMQSGSFTYAATWTSNFFFAFGERDYFAALQAEDLFLHTWSLGVEEQFYLVWPGLIVLFASLGTRGENKYSVRTVLFVSFVVIFLESLALTLYLSPRLPISSFYMMPARVWQFALGAAVYVGMRDLGEANSDLPVADRYERAILVAGLVGLLLVAGSTVFITALSSYSSYYAVAPSIGAALLLAAGSVSGNRGVPRILALRPLVWVGDRSYSIYLWHWPIFILGNSFGLSRSPYGIACLIGVSLLAASLSFRNVEYPFWKGGLSKLAPSRTMLFACTSIVLAIGVSAVLEHTIYGARDGVVDIVQNGSGDIADPARYDPRADLPSGIYRSGRRCDTSIRSSELVPCSVSYGDGDSVAVLLGDSIGVQWSPMIVGILALPDWQVIVLTKSACAIVDRSYDYDMVGGDYKICTDWRNSALDYIAGIQPDLVIAGSAATYNFTEAQWINGSSRILDSLSVAANQVVIIAGTPMLTFDGPSCLEDPYRFSFRLNDGSRECEQEEIDNGSGEVVTYLQRAIEKFPNVSLLDLGDLVCPDNKCAARSKEGIVVFRDQQHLTASFVESLIPEVRDRLEAVAHSARVKGAEE